MNHKVLLADDSLTIQKVIKITLANQPYDITECSNEEELFKQLPIVQPKIVFLDFNLSEKYTGYELTTKIKELVPTTKVLLLLGTFDTIDDSAFEKSGAAEKIVKPFDSNKFIALCNQLVDSSDDEADEEFGATEENESSETSEVAPEDQWQVNHTSEQSFAEPETSEATEPVNKNALDREVSDWGMSIPGVIGEQNNDEMNLDLPPVIGEVKSLDEQRQKSTDAKFPQEDDLDYPTVEELSAATEEKPKSKLIPIDSFNEKPLEIEGNYVPDETDVSSIEDQIRDEVEEDLWKADEFEDLKTEVSSKIEEMQNDFKPSEEEFDENLFRPLDENESIDLPASTRPDNEATNTNHADLKQEIEQMVKKYVQEYMDEMFKKNVEKVSWEVIPDLAENLIRQELNKISSKIIND